MKFTMERDALLSVLKKVTLAVEKRNTIPILDCVRIRANAAGDVVTFVGTDLDNEVTIMVGADVAERGEVCARAFPLLEIAEAVTAPVTIERLAGKDHVEVSSGAARYVDGAIGDLPAKDHPVFPDKDAEVTQRFAFDADALRQAIETVRFAISQEQTRFYLNGICIHAVIRGGRTYLRFVATNGHQLAWRDLPAPQGLTVLGQNIIPRGTVRILVGLLEGYFGEVSVDIAAEDKKIAFRLGSEIVLKAKLIDASYPDYSRVIPAEAPTEIVFDADALRGAVRRMGALLFDERAIQFDATTVDVELSSRNRDSVSAIERVACDIKGKGMAIGFNCRYVAVILERCEGRVIFRLTDPSSPAIIECPAEPDVQFVIMPMRI